MTQQSKESLELNLMERTKPICKEFSRIINEEIPPVIDLNIDSRKVTISYTTRGYGLAKLPDPYKGWIDHVAEGKYLTIFDMKNEDGKKLFQLFQDSTDDIGLIYDFRPTDSFHILGCCIERGKVNDLEWAILQTLHKNP